MLLIRHCWGIFVLAMLIKALYVHWFIPNTFPIVAWLKFVDLFKHLFNIDLYTSANELKRSIYMYTKGTLFHKMEIKNSIYSC